MTPCRFAALCLFPVVLAAAGDPGRWWKHIEYLASDQLEGRNTGSEGHRKAAEYVASQFLQLGLQPAGENGRFIQPVPFITKDLDESRSSLILRRDSGERLLKLGEDAIIGTRIDPVPVIDAEMVFVGYGLRIPEVKYDDFAGLDMKGRIAVYIGGAPANVSSALGAHYQTTASRWQTLRSVGAIGVIALPNPRHMDIPWPRLANNRAQMTMQLADDTMNDTAGEQIGITWNPDHADELLAGSGHKLEDLITLAEARKPLPRFPLDGRLKVKTLVKHGRVESQNVAAIYPGTTNEYVVLSAHLDHVGTGTPINGDGIFNGAMDNASGIASLLEVAAHLKETGAKPKRSILFVAMTGEEKGLLGSKYFSLSPTVPVKSIVADINIDMFLPLYPLKLLTVFGLAESSLGTDVTEVAKAAGIKVQPDPEPARNVFTRSDQYSFILRGIPSLMLDFGHEPGSKEAQLTADWLRDRYHAPSDDLNQPVDKQAAAQFNDLLERLALRVADAPKKPAWEKNSFFRRYAN